MIDILRTRRSIRKYEKRPIDQGSIDLLKEALLRCPSSRGLNPWTFLFVDDSAMLGKLSQSKEHGIRFCQGCAPCHRRLWRRITIGRVGGGLLHRFHNSPPHRPLPRARELLEPDQEQEAFSRQVGRGFPAGASRPPQEPEGRGNSGRRLPGRKQKPGTRGPAGLRKDKTKPLLRGGQLKNRRRRALVLPL